METQICTICEEKKEMSAFYKAGIYKGKRYYHKRCKACKALYAKEDYEKSAELRKEKMRAYYGDNAERLREAAKSYREAHKEEIAEYFREHYRRNSESVKARAGEWQTKNGERVRENKSAYKRRHPGRAALWQAKRRAVEARACPSWANRDAIDAIYAEARRLSEETGVEHHVDHIYPLNGKFVCGLHCEKNLRVLPWHENLKKTNKMPETENV